MKKSNFSWEKTKYISHSAFQNEIKCILGSAALKEIIMSNNDSLNHGLPDKPSFRHYEKLKYL